MTFTFVAQSGRLNVSQNFDDHPHLFIYHYIEFQIKRIKLNL